MVRTKLMPMARGMSVLIQARTMALSPSPSAPPSRLASCTDAPEMIESVTPGILPWSFEVALVDGADPTDLEIEMRQFHAVNEVVDRPDPDDRARAEALTGTTVDWPNQVDSVCSAAGRPVR